MSDFSTRHGASEGMQPKQISSRLMNMKFMQRAAASTAQRTPSSPHTPGSEPQAKRRRTGDFAATIDNLKSPSTPSTTANTPSYGKHTAISGAGLNGTTRRGTNNFDAPGVETEWVLDVRLPNRAGTTNGANGNNTSDDGSDNDEDSADELWSASAPRGRQTYGSFKKKHKTKTSTQAIIDPTTEQGSSRSTKKRGYADEFDDEDPSSLSSNSDFDEGSDGEIEEVPRPKKKKTGMFDSKSEAGLRKMDSFDFQRSGAGGLGRQRHGLGGGGGGAGGAHGSPSQPRRKDRKKIRKTM